MIVRYIRNVCVFGMLGWAIASPSAYAHSSVSEIIGPIIVDPAGPVEFTFPSALDLTHPVNLIFSGHARSQFPITGSLFEVTFDYLDPTDGIVFVGPFQVDVPEGAGTDFSVAATIPFSPQEVSLHLTSIIPVRIEGEFTQVSVPEVSSVGLVLVGMISIGLLTWSRKKSVISNSSVRFTNDHV